MAIKSTILNRSLVTEKAFPEMPRQSGKIQLKLGKKPGPSRLRLADDATFRIKIKTDQNVMISFQS